MPHRAGYMKKILILQPSSDQAQAIAKFLKKYSDDFFIVGGLMEGDSSRRSFPFFDKLEQITPDCPTGKNAYDIILPTGARSTKSFFTKGNHLRVGNIRFDQKNLQVSDKLMMLDLISKLQIPIPETYDSPDKIPAFPVFYKTRFETGGKGRGIIRDRKELQAIAQDNSIFFQEFIDSPFTYGVGFLARDGILITSFIQQEQYSYPKTGGSGVILQTFEDPELIGYTEKILKNLQYSGWGLVEFKYCPKRKDYVFMEVNAKFWASIEFTFLNNPVFFRELFDIRYIPERRVKCIIFLDRLALYGVRDYVMILLDHVRCYKLHGRRSLVNLCMGVIPAEIKKLMKWILSLTGLK